MCIGKIIGIVAIDSNNVIAVNNSMPWSIKEEMDFFKKTTQGHAILIGRKTLESIGHPLKNRINYVITKNTDFAIKLQDCASYTKSPDTFLFDSLEYAISHYKYCYPDKNLYIVGGNSIYTQVSNLCDEFYVSVINQELVNKYNVETDNILKLDIYPNIINTLFKLKETVTTNFGVINKYERRKS